MDLSAVTMQQLLTFRHGENTALRQLTLRKQLTYLLFVILYICYAKVLQKRANVHLVNIYIVYAEVCELFLPLCTVHLYCLVFGNKFNKLNLHPTSAYVYLISV